MDFYFFLFDVIEYSTASWKLRDVIIREYITLLRPAGAKTTPLVGFVLMFLDRSGIFNKTVKIESNVLPKCQVYLSRPTGEGGYARQENLFCALRKIIPRGVASRKKVNFLSVRFLLWANLRFISLSGYVKIKNKA